MLLPLMGALACGAPGLAPTRGDRVPERAVNAEGIRATFAVDGDYLRAPVLEAPDGATRVGVMVEVRSLDDRITLEARGAAHEDFRPAVWTFAEGTVRVAKIDLDAADFGVELRVPAADVDKIVQLTWSAVVPSPEIAPAVDVIGAADLGVSRRPLVITGANPRSAWNARATQCTSLNEVKTMISIHHTAGPGTPSPDYETRLRGIQAYHMDTRGWCDVGYHFLVTQDGQAWEARDARYIGAHVGGNNTNNLGISLVGCFQDQGCNDFEPFQPPQALLDATAALVAENAAHYGITISPATVMGHRDNPGQSTACPGDNVHALLDEIRAAASAGGNVDPGDPVEPPPADAGTVQGVVWDLSVSLDAGDALELGGRLGDAVITCDCGETANARDDDGYWSFDLAPGTYTFTATLEGYAPASREVQVTAGASLWASLGLNPLADSFELTLTVRDAETGAAIPGAQVQATGVAPALTDDDGRVALVLPAGEVTLLASAEDHEPASHVETFAAGAQVVRELHLAPFRREVEGGPEIGGLGDPEVAQFQDDCSCSASGDGDASEPTFAAALGLLALAALLRRRRR